MSGGCGVLESILGGGMIPCRTEYATTATNGGEDLGCRGVRAPLLPIILCGEIRFVPRLGSIGRRRLGLFLG